MESNVNDDEKPKAHLLQELRLLRRRLAQLEKDRAQDEPGARALGASDQGLSQKPNGSLSPEEEFNNLQLADIIDENAVQSLLNDFYALTHFPVSILDLQGKILAGVGWQDICTNFHRVHPETCQHCLESDIQLSEGVSPGQFNLYKCKNHLWDIATPIIVGGKKLGNLFSGQFFFEGEPLDYDLFRSQARKYEFNESEYIAALERVPRLTKESTEAGMAFLVKLAQMLSQLGYGNIKLARSLAERDTLMESLRQSEQKFRLLYDNAPLGYQSLDEDGLIVEINQTWLDILGYAREEVIGRWFGDFLAPGYVDHFLKNFPCFKEMGEICDVQFEMVRRDGTSLIVSFNGKIAYDAQGQFLRTHCLFQDITAKKQAEEELVKKHRELQESAQRLEQSNSMLQLIIESIPVRVFWKDKDFRFMGCNTLFARDAGLSQPQQVLGQDDFAMGWREQAESYRADDRQVMESRRPKMNIVEPQTTPTGAQIWLNTSKVPLQRPDGEVFGVLGVYEDITERKRAEEALEKRLIALSRPLDDAELIDFKDLFNMDDIQRIQDLFAKATGVASIITNPDGTPITKPSNFCRLCIDIIRQTELGLKNCYCSDAIIGRHHPEGPIVQPCLSGGLWDAGASITVGGKHIANWLIGQVRNEEQSEENMRAYAHKIGVNEEEFIKAFYEVTKMSGSQFKQVAEALFALANQLSTIAYQNVQQARFITERKRMDEALRDNEQFLTDIFNSIQDGLSVLDIDCNIIRVNPAMEKFPFSQPLVGRKCYEVYHGRSEPCVICPARQVLLTGKAAEKVFTAQMDDGSLEFVEIHAFPLLDHTGQVQQVIEYVRNVTERQRAEAERLRFSKLESLATLAGGIAHDFNNILTAILGNISLATLEIEDEDFSRERLNDAERACLQAQTLARQLLTFAKGGAPVKEPLSVEKLITESTSFSVRGSQVRVEFAFPDDLWSVEADPGQLNQVFQNLIINAVQAMPSGGIIEIRGENLVVTAGSDLPIDPGSYVKISVADQGVGMPDDYLTKIFDPYFTTKQRGSGLGLATAYSIMKSHHGHISVQSKLGSGTVFEVYLPACAHKIIPVREEERGLIIGQGKILVMDDEEMVRQVLGKMLNRLGYEAEFARDGKEAIAQFTRAREAGESFAAVILDLTVPGGVGGKKVIKKLLEIDPQVRALVASGYSADPIMAEYEKYGFRGIIGKPFKVSELGEVLHKVIFEKS